MFSRFIHLIAPVSIEKEAEYKRVWKNSIIPFYNFGRYIKEFIEPLELGSKVFGLALRWSAIGNLAPNERDALIKSIQFDVDLHDKLKELTH